MVLKKNTPIGFDAPTTLPENKERNQVWQNDNRNWWENHPMRYDWKEEIGYEEFSKNFYLEIDRRFFSDVKCYMPWSKIPFDNILDFNELYKKDVLEIGVGNGSHAQLLAQHAKSFIGIDLTKYAVKSTLERMKLFNLNGKISEMDAEELQFDDNSFDLIWTWGVIHHSANTKKILSEIHRTLRPKGRAIIMVYHRSIWNYYLMSALLQGIFSGNLFKTRNIHKTVQKHTDGAIARYYSQREWKSLVSELFDINYIRIYGSKTEIIPLPGGKLKKIFIKLLPDSFGRFITNRLKFGSFLVSELVRN